MDGVTFQLYEQDLEENLRELVQRLRNKSYHARLVRRKYLPKGEGKWRPLGIPVLEDKLVQLAVAQILSAIYEADFLPCNQGYRPERGAQQAARELAEVLTKGRIEFVVEVDIKGYFEHLQHPWLLKMLARRIADGALLGLIAKWLKAGILVFLFVRRAHRTSGAIMPSTPGWQGTASKRSRRLRRQCSCSRLMAAGM